MLKGISPLLSPALLGALCEMGHGDEIDLADAHFPAATLGRRVIRADGLRIADLLAAMLPLFELDRSPGSPVTMTTAAAGDELDPNIEAEYLGGLRRHAPDLGPPARIGRFDFYERARQAFAVVATGDTATYTNVMLRKGVTPSS